MSVDFDTVRETVSTRWLALGVAAVTGLLVATVHPLGLLVGGALVSLPARDWKRGLLAGLGFGLLVLAVFAVLLALGGAFARYLAMGRITAVSVAIPLVLGTVGGLARLLRPT
jgi:hypothetical protein